MHSCEVCGKAGSNRQVPVVRVVVINAEEFVRVCYQCIRDGLESEIIEPEAPVFLTAEDYIQCLTTPVEIEERPALWTPGQGI